MDWTRTLWDLTTDSNVSTTDIYRFMSSLGGNRVTTYFDALARADSMGITSFGSRARGNGIDW